MPRSGASKRKKETKAKAPPSRGAFTIQNSDDGTKEAGAVGTRSKNPGGHNKDAADREPPATPDANQRASSRRRAAGLDAFVTPVSKKLKTTAAAVTPEEPTATAEAKALSQYVPKYIHKNLDYKRKGEKDLPKMTRDVYRLVCDHYEIPENFEQVRAFGPLSGMSYEERVIREYSIGHLSPKEGSEAVSICTSCASLGHKRPDCPTLV